MQQLWPGSNYVQPQCRYLSVLSGKYCLVHRPTQVFCRGFAHIRAGTPERFWYIRLHRVDMNVTSCQPSIMLLTCLSHYCTDSWPIACLAGINVASLRRTSAFFSSHESYVTLGHLLPMLLSILSACTGRVGLPGPMAV